MLKRKSRRSLTTQNKKGFQGPRDPLLKKFIRFCASDFGRRVLDHEADYLRKELAGRKRILEIGCGLGVFAERLADLNITGLDRSEAMLQEARKRSDKIFIRGSAYHLPLESSSLDAVFFVTTLEFLEDYPKAVTEAARVLEKNGKLIVMMLNPESEYFQTHVRKPGDYFRRIKHTDVEGAAAYIGRFFKVETGYLLGVRGEEIFDSTDPRWAALYVIRGIKK